MDKKKKPLTTEEMKKKLKDAVSSDNSKFSNNSSRVKSDSIDVPLEGKTGRPVVKPFGFKGISEVEKLKQTFWNKSSQPKPGETKLYDRREGFNYPLSNKWEDEAYGAEIKKKKKK